jgi:glucose-1-phosphate thymidylyltransferase
VLTVELCQGLKVACLEKIAFNSGWINTAELKEQANKFAKTDYSQYLLKLLNEADI